MGSSARRISSGCRKRQTAGIKEKRMHYCGDFRTTYRKDMEIFQTPFIKVCMAAFLGVGAYTSAYVTAKMGLSFWVGIPAAGLVTALAGMVFGIPSLRLKGLYLAIATLASQFILEWIFVRWEPVTGGSYGITIPRPTLAGFTFASDRSSYFLVLVIAVAMILFASTLMRTRTGRAFMAGARPST